MTLEQLRVFVEVAERLHVTRAAAVLNMTQPAASAAIHALETRLGTVLFNRVGRGLELTEAGTVLRFQSLLPSMEATMNTVSIRALIYTVALGALIVTSTTTNAQPTHKHEPADHFAQTMLIP
jgi:DNA-binding transcriptional LysR family regulator